MYDVLTYLLNRYKPNELFCVSYRVLAKGNFGYKVIGVGKQNTEYFYDDLKKFGLVSEHSAKRLFNSSKNVYMAGLNTFENYYFKFFAYNFVFYTYRMYYYYIFVTRLLVYLMYSLIYMLNNYVRMSFVNFFFRRRKVTKMFGYTPFFYNRFRSKIVKFSRKNLRRFKRSVLRLRYEMLFVKKVRFNQFKKDIIFKYIRHLRYRRRRRMLRKLKFFFLFNGYTRSKRKRNRRFEIYTRLFALRGLVNRGAREELVDFYKLYFGVRREYRQLIISDLASTLRTDHLRKYIYKKQYTLLI